MIKLFIFVIMANGTVNMQEWPETFENYKACNTKYIEISVHARDTKNLTVNGACVRPKDMEHFLEDIREIEKSYLGEAI